MNTNAYENAPATRMLATNCAACGRPLLDAVSVEIGMGPDCRKQYATHTHIDEDKRNAANKLIYEIAMHQTGKEIIEPLNQLVELGYKELVKKIAKRCSAIHITEADGRYCVKTPFNEDSISAWKRIPGRRWDAATKTNNVPTEQKQRLWNLLQTYYPNHVACGPKGFFFIPD